MDYYTLQYELDKQKREQYMMEAQQERLAREGLKPAAFNVTRNRRADESKQTDL